jgi:hypothetical protein
MKSVLKSFYTKPLVIYLSVALLAISTFAGPAEAMFVPAAPYQKSAAYPMESVGRAADIDKVQTALESKIIHQKLMDYGLSADEAMARVNMLSDEQLHQLAAQADSLQAGGDAVGVFVALVIVALLVVLLIYLVQGRIAIR